MFYGPAEAASKKISRASHACWVHGWARGPQSSWCSHRLTWSPPWQWCNSECRLRVSGDRGWRSLDSMQFLHHQCSVLDLPRCCC